MTRKIVCGWVALACIACSGCASSTPAVGAAPAPGAAPLKASSAAPALPAGVTQDLIAGGDAIFNGRSCAKCHGMAGVGTQNGPSLVAGAWLQIDGSYSEIIRLVTTGVPKEQIKDPAHQFNMRPRGGMQPLLTDDEVRAAAAYVWSISRKKTR